MGEPIWKNDAFCGLFVDSYVGGTELDGGHIANSLGLMTQILERMVKRDIFMDDADKAVLVRE